MGILPEHLKLESPVAQNARRAPQPWIEQSEPVGDGVLELREHLGAGYSVYFVGTAEP